MSTPIVSQLPPDVSYTTLLSKLSKARDREALLELSPVIFEIISQIPKASTSLTNQCFVNRSKKLLKNGRPYKIHTFFHPASNCANMYVFFSKDASDQITSRTSLTKTTHIQQDSNKTFTELSCANKIFHTSYQIACVGKKVISIRPVAKLSGNFRACMYNRVLHQKKVDALERELNFLREFIGVPDICQLVDGARYMGTHKFQNTTSKQLVKEKVEKVVMYQELYSSDLCDVFLEELATKPKQDRLILVAPLLYRLLRGAMTIDAAGIAHQDLKMENIFLSILYKLGPNNIYSPVIGDFGCARRKDDMSQSRFGTLGYFAPELHERPNGIDEGDRVDIWNLGYIFFQLLNGILPEWVNLIDCADACQNILSKINRRVEEQELINGTQKSNNATQTLNFEKYSVDVFKKLKEAQEKLKEFEKQHLQEINTYFQGICGETTTLVNEVAQLDTSMLVRLVIPEPYSPSEEAVFLTKKLSPVLTNFNKFIDISFESLTKEQILTVRMVISKLNTALVQKRQAIWESLNRVSCPVNHAPQTLEEAVIILMWNMLKPHPKERISHADALDFLSQFTTDHRVLVPLEKA